MSKYYKGEGRNSPRVDPDPRVQVHYPMQMLLPMALINLFSELDYTAGRAEAHVLAQVFNTATRTVHVPVHPFTTQALWSCSRLNQLRVLLLAEAMQDVFMTKTPSTAWLRCYWGASWKLMFLSSTPLSFMASSNVMPFFNPAEVWLVSVPAVSGADLRFVSIQEGQ